MDVAIGELEATEYPEEGKKAETYRKVMGGVIQIFKSIKDIWAKKYLPDEEVII